YDKVGNRSTEVRPAPSGTTTYTYNGLDELTQAGSTAYTYDQNGNVTERYDVGPSDIVRDDPLRQDIWFRVGGQEKRFHGSYQKERY
ncbi:MAG: hypothetical protein ACJ8LM_12740, partial [Candidatus Udaeobacter sp.]